MRNALAFLCAATGLAACFADPAPNETDGTTASPGTTDAATTAETEAPPTDGVTTDAPTGTSGPSPDCEGASQTLVLSRPNAMLVLDKSVLMVAEPWDHDAAPDTPAVTRWSSLHAAVDGALAEFEDRIDIGANLSPAVGATVDYSPSSCVVSETVEVPVKPLNRSAILAAIPEKSNTELKGAYPAATALTIALDHLKSLDPDERRTLVMLAFGLPACSADAATNEALFEVYDENAPAVVEAAFAVDGIPIHVITLAVADEVNGMLKDSEPDGVNGLEKFTELAAKGGAGPLVNATTEAQLGEALRAALATVLVDDPGCVLPLTETLEFPDQAVVRVDGVEVARVTDCAGADGWRFVEAAAPFKTIELCGAACEQLRQAGEAEVVDCQDPIGAPPWPGPDPEAKG